MFATTPFPEDVRLNHSPDSVDLGTRVKHRKDANIDTAGKLISVKNDFYNKATRERVCTNDGSR